MTDCLHVACFKETLNNKTGRERPRKGTHFEVQFYEYDLTYDSISNDNSRLNILGVHFDTTSFLSKSQLYYSIIDIKSSL